MSGQCVVSVGAEDDWRGCAGGFDEERNTLPQCGTWTAAENWQVNGNDGAGIFLMREERRRPGKMRLSADVNIGI